MKTYGMAYSMLDLHSRAMKAKVRPSKISPMGMPYLNAGSSPCSGVSSTIVPISTNIPHIEVVQPNPSFAFKFQRP